MEKEKGLLYSHEKTMDWCCLIPIGSPGPIFRGELNKLNNHVVCDLDIQKRLTTVIYNTNLLPGPVVEWDVMRNCYGLRADRFYRVGETITHYGGKIHFDPKGRMRGDYLAALGKSGSVVDGYSGFKLWEKGRWINESDRERKVVNVEITRIKVVALCDILQGEWIFADYGEEYERSY